jgi:hypothetical protein
MVTLRVQPRNGTFFAHSHDDVGFLIGRVAADSLAVKQTTVAIECLRRSCALLILLWFYQSFQNRCFQRFHSVDIE